MASDGGGVQVPWKELKQAKGEGAMVTLVLAGSEEDMQEARETLEELLAQESASGEMKVAARQVQGIIGKVASECNALSKPVVCTVGICYHATQ